MYVAIYLFSNGGRPTFWIFVIPDLNGANIATKRLVPNFVAIVQTVAELPEFNDIQYDGRPLSCITKNSKFQRPVGLIKSISIIAPNCVASGRTVAEI